MVLTGYGLPHVIGLLPTRDGVSHPSPLDAIGLMDAALGWGLSGIEIDLAWAAREHSPDRLRDELDRRNLRLVADTGILLDIELESWRGILRLAAELGAKVVRTLISNCLCGDRRRSGESWEERIEATARRLRDLLPLAEGLGLSIAIENHQDATSADLIRLHESSGCHPAFGVTFDTGNPLAVGEGPVEAIRRVAPLLRHLHLKDYTMQFAPEGYCLARCPAGTGIIDFPAILSIVEKESGGHIGDDLLPGIEIAAQPARVIPCLEEGWWETYPSDHARFLPEALRLLWAKGRPVDDSCSSAWERGADTDKVSREEWDVAGRSAAYFREIYEGRRGDDAGR